MSTKLIINPVTGDLSPVIPSLTNLGKYKHTRGSIPPSSPNKGDTFEEVTLPGEWIQNWFWNGTYWLSTKTKNFDYSFQGVSGSNTQETYYSLDNKWNIFITDFYMSVMLTYANDSANYWTLTLASRKIGANNLSYIDFLSTANLAPNDIYFIKKTLNLHLLTNSVTLLDYRWSKINNPSAVDIGSASVIYRFARP